MNKERRSQKMIHGQLAALMLIGLLATFTLISFAGVRNTASLDSSLEGLGMVKVEGEQAAPGFTLTDPSGKAVRLTDLRGKVIFLTFWATW